MKLRDDVLIRRHMEFARVDLDDAKLGKNVELKNTQRSRARMSVKFSRLRLHRLMREARATR